MCNRLRGSKADRLVLGRQQREDGGEDLRGESTAGRFMESCGFFFCLGSEDCLVFLRGMLQEYAQEADDPISDWLALLDAHDPEHTSHHLGVELFLVEVFLLLALVLVPTLLARVWWLEAACFLYLPQVHH